MVTKQELEKEVAGLRDQLTDAASGAVSAGRAAAVEVQKAVEAHLGDNARDQIRALAEAQGKAVEELKGVGERLLGEIRDMPQKKPLVTLLGIFVLGVAIGRMSRK